MKRNYDVILRLTVNGKIEFIPFSVEQLRNWIDNLAVASDQKYVNLQFDLNNQTYLNQISVDTLLPQIKRAIRLVELSSKNIIPRSLCEYLTDLTLELTKKTTMKIVCREFEINKAWFYLSQQTRNNVFLVGPHDVGKTAIATEIAQRIALNLCPKEFYHKRVISFNPSLLLTIKSRFVFTRTIEQLLSFLDKNKKDIILFIDKVFFMLSDSYLISVLIKCLRDFNIPLIVTSCQNNFGDYFGEDFSIAKYINYLYIDEPDFKDVELMVKPHIRRLQRQYGIKIYSKTLRYAIFTSELGDSTTCNPGKVINILERAFVESKRNGLAYVDKKSILSCYDTEIKNYLKMPENEKRATAYHEVGHYILFAKSKHLKNVKISCVSILPMSYWVGVTMQYHDISEYAVKSKEYFLDYIATYLAGRIAEKKFTDLNSTGASSDLEYANNMAKAMVMQWGFSSDSANFNRSYDYMDLYLMPESKKKLIDDEVQQLINEGTRIATKVIEENEELLKIIAEKLLVDEVLTGKELTVICQEYEQSKLDT